MLCSINLYINIIYLSAIYFTYAVGKWCIVFKYCFFIISIYHYCYCVYSLSYNCCSSFNKYVCITVITKTWLQHDSLKFNLTIGVICSTCIIIYILVFCSKFIWLNNFIVQQILLFFDIPFYLLININLSSSIVSCLFSGDIYLSLGVLV